MAIHKSGPSFRGIYIANISHVIIYIHQASFYIWSTGYSPHSILSAHLQDSDPTAENEKEGLWQQYDKFIRRKRRI